MTYTEFRQLHADLAETFPKWFKLMPVASVPLLTCFRPNIFKWDFGYDALLGACFDAAISRGWKLCVTKSPSDHSWATVESLHEGEVYTATGKHKIVYAKAIAFQTNENVALAAALALLKAHTVSVGKP